MAALPAAVSADGLIDAIQGRQDAFANFFSSKSTDTATGTTTRIDVDTVLSRSVYQLNYNLLPTLNLNAGGTTERNLTSVSGDVDDSETLGSRFRPYVWLTLRDPVFGATLGYELAEDKSTPERAQALTLSRESYTGGLSWKPVDLPFTHARFLRTTTSDGARHTLDTQEDQLFVRSEYAWRGFSGAYAGSYLDTLDKIREATTTQTSHDGRLLYALRLFDGRVSLSTEHRLRYTKIAFDQAAATGLPAALLAVSAAAGLSAIDDSPETDALAANALLNDDDTTSDAGINIGASQSGGARRNVGLDFGAGTTPTVTTLRVWINQDLTPNAAGAFSWDIYTSANGTDWTFHAHVDQAPFGPFDRRFEISVPAVATRFIKAVTRPLSAANPDAAQFPNIAVTEVDAFVDRATARSGRANKPIVSTNRSHTFDATVVLMRAPSLHYRFAADYSVAETEGAAIEVPARYSVSNGLFFTHRFHRMLATSANTALELGSEQGASRTAITYAASLAATPLRTLTDSLVWSGNRVSTAGTTSTTNSLVFYNTAQLYQGLDATANAGMSLSTEDAAGGSAERTQRYVTLGVSTVPHRTLTLSAFYTGRQTESSGGATSASERTEQQLDLGVLFAPFRTLSVSAAVGITSQTEEERRVIQNYAVNWNPFPDGTLLLSLSYAENRLTEESTSRTLQPSLRWYLTTRRRSYLEATYQMATTESNTVTVESRSFNAALSIPF